MVIGISRRQTVKTLEVRPERVFYFSSQIFDN